MTDETNALPDPAVAKREAIRRDHGLKSAIEDVIVCEVGILSYIEERILDPILLLVGAEFQDRIRGERSEPDQFITVSGEWFPKVDEPAERLDWSAKPSEGEARTAPRRGRTCEGCGGPLDHPPADAHLRHCTTCLHGQKARV